MRLVSPTPHARLQGDGLDAGLYYYAPEQQLSVFANVSHPARLGHMRAAVRARGCVGSPWHTSLAPRMPFLH